jgi:hypothetical protein
MALMRHPLRRGHLGQRAGFFGTAIALGINPRLQTVHRGKVCGERNLTEYSYFLPNDLKFLSKMG